MDSQAGGYQSPASVQTGWRPYFLMRSRRNISTDIELGFHAKYNPRILLTNGSYAMNRYASAPATFTPVSSIAKILTRSLPNLNNLCSFSYEPISWHHCQTATWLLLVNGS